MYLKFEKWHGCQNDFIVTWMSEIDGEVVLGSIKRQAARLCHRHQSVGADGILVLHTQKPGDLTPNKLTIINSDGSIAANCGNGLRCAALSVLERYKEHGDPKELPEFVELEVEGDVKTCRFMPGKRGGFPLVAIEMGVPVLGRDLPWFTSAKEAVDTVAKQHHTPQLGQEWGACEIGNSHLVFILEETSRAMIQELGPAFQTAGSWDGINVHLAVSAAVSDEDHSQAGNEIGGPLAELYKVHVWERGAGETMACGSGACAVAAVVAQTGLVERSEWMGIDMPGGRLYVKHEEDEEPVLLAGPGDLAFTGSVEI